MFNYLFEIPTWCLWKMSTFSNTGSDFPCGSHEAQPVSHCHPRNRGVTLGSLTRGCSWMTGLIHPGVPSICCWHLLCGLRSLSDDVIPCLCPSSPHEGNPAALTSAVKVQGGWICWAETETSGYVMLHKLPVTVTPHESPVKRYLTTIPCVLICSGGLFSFGSWLFRQSRDWRDMSALQFVLHHLYPSGGLLRSRHVQHIPVLTQLWPIQCKQTIYPLFIQIISQYAMSACSARWEESEQMHQEVGAELQLGIKMPTLHYGWSRSLLLASQGLD